MKNAKFSRWVFVLDYHADPETDASILRKAIEAELDGFRDAVVIVGESVILSNPDDALSMRMRFNDHIVSIHKIADQKELVA